MSPTLVRLRQPISFLAVGASSTAVYFLMLWALQGQIESTILLTAWCYAGSMVYNYILQSLITFRAGAPTGRSVTRFVVMHGVAMALNSLVMAALVDGLQLPIFASQVLVTGGITIMVYLVSKHWVYKPAS